MCRFVAFSEFFRVLFLFGLTIDLPSLKLTAHPWKWMFGRLISFWGPAYFQGRAVSFRKCISMFNKREPGMLNLGACRMVMNWANVVHGVKTKSRHSEISEHLLWRQRAFGDVAYRYCTSVFYALHSLPKTRHSENPLGLQSLVGDMLG